MPFRPSEDNFARRRTTAKVPETEAEARQRQGERDASRQETLDSIRSFDPGQFSERAAGGLFAGLSDRFNRLHGARNVGLNRRGIFGSPIGSSAITRDFNEGLSGALARLSMDEAGLAGQNIDRLANFSAQDRAEAQRGRDRELEFLTGEADREQARDNERHRRKQEKFGFDDALKLGVEGASRIIPSFF